eukprot:gene20889-30206_t
MEVQWRGATEFVRAREGRALGGWEDDGDAFALRRVRELQLWLWLLARAGHPHRHPPRAARWRSLPGDLLLM